MLVVKKTALSNEGNLRSCVYVGIVVLSSYTGTIYKDVCKEKKDHKGIKTTLEAETVITPYTQGPRGGRGCWNFEGERIMDSRPTLREAELFCQATWPAMCLDMRGADCYHLSLAMHSMTSHG